MGECVNNSYCIAYNSKPTKNLINSASIMPSLSNFTVIERVTC